MTDVFQPRQQKNGKGDCLCRPGERTRCFGPEKWEGKDVRKCFEVLLLKYMWDLNKINDEHVIFDVNNVK